MRAAVISLCAVSTHLPVDNVNFEKSTGTWLLTLPDGVERISKGCNGEQNIAKPTGTSGGLPLLPGGQEIILDEQDGSGVGGKIWRSAAALCRWQLSMQDEIRGSRVLELGSGTGASGLFAAGLGASRVVLTDGQEELIPLLERNAERNGGVVNSSDVITAAHWLFGESAPAGVSEIPFDMVIGSDITYAVSYSLEDDGEPEDRHALCRTLRALLQENRQLRCVIAHEHRRADMFDIETIVANQPCARWDENDNCLGIFLESADEHGLTITPLVLERGQRTQPPDSSVVEMTTDLSVFEVTLA